jgi:hypothetical protein
MEPGALWTSSSLTPIKPKDKGDMDPGNTLLGNMAVMSQLDPPPPHTHEALMDNANKMQNKQLHRLPVASNQHMTT